MKIVFITAFALTCYGSYKREQGVAMTIADFYFLAGMLLTAMAICADEIVQAIRKAGDKEP